ncbi:hypothetical protein [Verrucomicrobium spinosum]|uniref:hypothetical protein n=1 Tax=Verrucomicrobium spinosum TaxID=2736 RepID=UPI00155D9BBD|nr:hypothetical protein [Verrucomicrobium spinosum]
MPSTVVDDNGELIIQGRVIDKDGGAGKVSQKVTILNVSPTVHDLAVSGPVLETGTVTLTGKFTDPGAGDDHMLTIDWADGSTETLTITAANPASFAINQAGSGFVNTVNAAVSGGSGTGMIVNLLAGEDGGLAAVQVVSTGSGYRAGDVLSIGNASFTLVALRTGTTTDFASSTRTTTTLCSPAVRYGRVHHQSHRDG